ncbi:Uncharacterized protein Rs2_45215 [Raphanus sativus]|nr:Uncharacterized protein Rs2_45215 [Raphanus sativus]
MRNNNLPVSRDNGARIYGTLFHHHPQETRQATRSHHPRNYQIPKLGRFHCCPSSLLYPLRYPLPRFLRRRQDLLLEAVLLAFYQRLRGIRASCIHWVRHLGLGGGVVIHDFE